MAHQAQLEPGEIYCQGETFRYVYDLSGKLWLNLDSVCNVFHLFTFRERVIIDPQSLRYVTRQLSSKLNVRSLVVNECGVRQISNRGVRKRWMRNHILRLFEEYDQQEKQIKKGQTLK
jgi:hypothetical protein